MYNNTKFTNKLMLVCLACPRSLELNRRLECRRALPRYRRGNRDCGIESRFSRIVHSRSRSNVLDSFRSMTRLIAGPENMKNNAPRGRNCLPILSLQQTALQGMSLHFLRLNFVKFTRKESEIGTCGRFTRPPQHMSRVFLLRRVTHQCHVVSCVTLKRRG